MPIRAFFQFDHVVKGNFYCHGFRIFFIFDQTKMNKK